MEHQCSDLRTYIYYAEKKKLKNYGQISLLLSINYKHVGVGGQNKEVFFCTCISALSKYIKSRNFIKPHRISGGPQKNCYNFFSGRDSFREDTHNKVCFLSDRTTKVRVDLILELSVFFTIFLSLGNCLNGWKKQTFFLSNSNLSINFFQIHEVQVVYPPLSVLSPLKKSIFFVSSLMTCDLNGGGVKITFLCRKTPLQKHPFHCFLVLGKTHIKKWSDH